MKIINPANNKVIKEIEGDTKESLNEKFQKLKNSSWRDSEISYRVECLKRFSEGLVSSDNFEKFATDLSLEVGKPLRESKNELNGAVKKMKFFIEKASEFLNPEKVNQDNTVEEVIDFSPLGVIANISAWNYPYLVGINIFVPALLTGNAVLYKPSEHALMTGKNIETLLHQSGIPEDAFIMIAGDGEIGKNICELDIDGMFFTGSYKTGKAIATAVASKLIPVGMELGGKDPLYVTEEISDIKSTAAAVAEGAFYNNGQSCCSVERVYVHKAVYDQFVDSFISEVQSFVVGDPFDEKTTLGAITRSEHLKVLTDQVEDALNKGAKLECGGAVIESEGNFFAPTVLTNVNHDMKIMKEESFGPVIGIHKVESDDQAIALMNDSEYGLTSSVYTTNTERGKKILKQIDSGSGYLNCCDRVSGYLPWAGRKHSGLGLTLSKYGLLPFLRTKSYHFNT